MGTPEHNSAPGNSSPLFLAAFEALLGRSNDFLLLLDSSCRIRAASTSLVRAVINDGDMVGRNFLGMLDSGSQDKARAFLAGTQVGSPAVELNLRAADGTACLTSFTFCRFDAPDGTTCIVAVGREQEDALRLVAQVIGLNQELEVTRRELERQAMTDPLTGLGNRRWLFEGLDALWVTAAQRDGLVWVIMADLDHFKKINDNYGHQAGDEVLKASAKALRGAVRADDLVARYGGEEFVLAGTCRDRRELLRVTARLLAAIRSLGVNIPGRTLRLSVSLGAVLARPGPTCAPSLALRIADAAVYRAKDGGRDRCEIEPGVIGQEADAGGQPATGLPIPAS